MDSAPVEDRVIAYLQQHREKAWLVGGYVRDRLRGDASHDMDVIVPDGGIRLARSIANAFDGAWFILDEARDVGRAILGRDATVPLCVDVARLRAPDLLTDLSLRDFTVNAMALDLQFLESVIDPFDGEADLATGTIRAVTEGAFTDDPLRILRGVRLAAELGLRIEDATFLLMRRDAALLQGVAGERVRDELDRIVAAARSWRWLHVLAQLGVLRVVLPESAAQIRVAQSPPHYQDVFGHTQSVLAHLETLLALLSGEAGASGAIEDDEGLRVAGAEAWNIVSELIDAYGGQLQSDLQSAIGSGRQRSSLLKWAALMHDWGKPAVRSVAGQAVHFYRHEDVGARLAVERATSLHFSNGETQYLRAVVGLHMRLPLLAQETTPSDRAVYRLCRDASNVGPDLVLLALADRLSISLAPTELGALERTVAVAKRVLLRYRDGGEGGPVPAPLLDGSRIMAFLGIPSGPRVGRIIEGLREAQAIGEVRTEAEAYRWLGSRSAREGE